MNNKKRCSFLIRRLCKKSERKKRLRRWFWRRREHQPRGVGTAVRARAMRKGEPRGATTTTTTTLGRDVFRLREEEEEEDDDDDDGSNKK